MTGNADAHWSIVPAAEFERDASAWDALATSAYPPFMRADFIAPALRQFGIGNERLALCRSSTRAVAMAIVAPRRFAVWETFQPSQLPLGAFVHDGSRPLGELFQTLLRGLPRVAAAVAITQQDPQIVVRPTNTARLRTLDYIETARVVVDKTFDAYWAARGKNLRTNVKRQLARLASENRSARLDVVAAPAGVPAAIVEYGRLESAGWKAAGGTAVAQDNAQGRFYTQVFEAFCARSRARIYRYLVDEQVAAMDLCLEDDGVVVVLKTAYDEAFGSLSPATLMRYAYFRTLFEAGTVRRI